MIASSGLPHAQGERAAPDVNGRHASQRYLLISSTPDSLGDLIAALLTQAAEVTITNPEAADRHRVLALRPDVVLLQVGSLAQLQEVIEELRSWRAMSPTPVLAFVGYNDLDATAMPAGVDDFVVVPWDASEVLARIRRFLQGRRATLAGTFDVGPITLDVRQRACIVDGVRIDLTFIEFEVLKALAMQPNRFLGPTELLRIVWDGRHPVRLVTLRVWIKRLRDKLPRQYRGLIETRRSVGYRLMLEPVLNA
jgi:DNA-binding response OmpR family regulator